MKVRWQLRNGRSGEVRPVKQPAALPGGRSRKALRLALGSITWRRYQVFLAVALCYLLSAKFGVRFTVMPEGAAILWPSHPVSPAAINSPRRRSARVSSARSLARAGSPKSCR